MSGPVAPASAAAPSAHRVDVMCVGETMVQLVPEDPQDGGGRLLRLQVAGAESNVAIGLVRLGSRAAWVGRVGSDRLGRIVLQDLGDAGVDVSLAKTVHGSPTGVFLKDPGPTGSSVTYYRRGSAAAGIDQTDIDRALTTHPAHLHLSGVTPALSATCRAAVTHALDAAHDLGVSTSFDINYRAAVWPDRAQAAEVLATLAARADIVLVGLDEASSLWGTESAEDVAEVVRAPAVVVKDAEREAVHLEAGVLVREPALAVDVVEPVGAGDAFAAGWLHGFLTDAAPRDRLRLGHLMAAEVLRIHADTVPRGEAAEDLPARVLAHPPTPHDVRTDA